MLQFIFIFNSIMLHSFALYVSPSLIRFLFHLYSRMLNVLIRNFFIFTWILCRFFFNRAFMSFIELRLTLPNRNIMPTLKLFYDKKCNSATMRKPNKAQTQLMRQAWREEISKKSYWFLFVDLMLICCTTHIVHCMYMQHIYSTYS